MPEFLESSSPWIIAGLTLLVGLLIAAGVAALVNFVARRLLRDPKAAGDLAGAIFWIIAAVALVIAVARLTEPEATQRGVRSVAERLLTALPDLIVGLLVLALGWALAIALRSGLRALMARHRPELAEPVAVGAFWALFVVTVLVAAAQLGIAVGLPNALVVIAVAAVAGAGALALGLGGRAVVAALAAGRQVSRLLEVGDTVEVDGRRGTVVRLGPMSVSLAVDEGELLIPNERFLSTPVLVTRRPG